MTELHLILFISILLTIMSHLVGNKKAKFFIRGMVALLSFVSLALVLMGVQFAFISDFNWIQDYLKLRIDAYSFVCFMVVALTSLYSYRFFFENEGQEKTFRASFDLILISSLLVALTSSFFIYVMMIELVSLIIVPSLVKSISSEEGLSDISLYQLSLIVIVPAIAAFSLLYSVNSEILTLFNLDMSELRSMTSVSIPGVGLWISLLLLIYFITRFSLVFYLSFASIGENKPSAVTIPLLSSLILIGFVKYIKPLVDTYQFFSFSYLSCFFLLLFAFLAADFRSKDQGKFYIKKAFQLLVLLMMCSLFPGVVLKDSFYESSSILLITNLFLAISYSHNYHLSIIAEIKKNGAWGVGILASLVLIILNLSPVPFAPIVYSIYENLQVIIQNSLLASLLILCIYGVITLPVLYQLQDVEEAAMGEQRVTLNISSLIFIAIYIFLLVFMSWEGIR